MPNGAAQTANPYPPSWTEEDIELYEILVKEGKVGLTQQDLCDEMGIRCRATVRRRLARLACWQAVLRTWNYPCHYVAQPPNQWGEYLDPHMRDALGDIHRIISERGGSVPLGVLRDELARAGVPDPRMAITIMESLGYLEIRRRGGNHMVRTGRGGLRS